MPKRLPRTRTLKGDVPLAHYDSGAAAEGEIAIVLLHSSLTRSEDWENIFPRVATRYRTVAYDARGHGKSGRATDYALRAFADDALRVVRDLVKTPAVLIGHSLGALAAIAVAAELPDRVKGLVLEDPPLAYGAPWPAATYAPLQAALSAGDPAALRRAVDRFPLPSPGPRGERTYGEMRGFYAAERVITYFSEVDPAFIASRIQGEDARPVITAWLEKIVAPTVVIAGEPRLGANLDDANEWKLKRALKDLTVRRFPGTGHVVHGYRPEQFLENIEPFLRNLRG